MSVNFTHLHVHTQYSLLDGAAKISDLVAYAKEIGMKSLAITDHGVMYGVVDFYQEAMKQGIKPVIGCEVYLTNGSRFEKTNRDGMYHLILLAENDEGYHNLMKLVSLGHLEGFYYKPRIDKDILRQYSKGIICMSACIAGEIPVQILRGNLEGAENSLKDYLDIFGKDNFFLEIQDHDLEEEHTVNTELKRLAKKYDLGLVATNDSHYVKREDADAQDVLLCIQTTSTVDDPKRMKFPNDQFYLKSEAEMREKFGDCPEALENTAKIAERCNVELSFGHLLLPEFPIPNGLSAEEYLRKLCLDGLHFQFIIRTIDKVACSLDPDGHYSVFLFHCCGLLRQCGGGEHRCCCCAEHECRCQHKGYQSFGLHRIRPPVFQRITQPYPPARCIGNRHDVMPCYTPILPQNAVSVNNWIQVIQMFYIFAQKRACLRSRPSRLVIHR